MGDGGGVTVPRDRWRTSDCAVLAVALRRRLGWPLVTVSGELATSGWVHMALLAPDGRVLDADGLRPPTDVLDQYADFLDLGEGEALLVEVDPLRLRPDELRSDPDTEALAEQLLTGLVTARGDGGWA